MSEQNEQRRPSFNIMEPNPLLGNRTLILFNPEMSRSLCELIEQQAESQSLTDEQKHLYAFAKRLRAHYYGMSQMFAKRDAGESFTKREAISA